MNLGPMSKPDKKIFMDAAEIDEALAMMEQDKSLKTSLSLSRAKGLSLTLESFREKHAQYLREHPKINPQDYLSNLRTMIKIRPN